MHSRQNKNINIIVWDPFEMYDPRHPNDYHEYKNWKRQEREERRMEEFRKREDRKRPRESSASEYTSDEHSDDGRRRDRKAREYGDALTCPRAHCRPARFHSPEREDEDMPRGLGAHLPHQMPTEAVGGEAQDTRPAMPQPSTGEEAYLRRLAMSRGVAPPAPIPAPIPAPVQQESAPPVSTMLNIPKFATATMMSAQTTAQAFQPAQDSEMRAPSTVASSPAEPQSELPLELTSTVPLVSQAVPAVAPPTSTQITIEEKLKNAAAIAARLSALVKSAPPEPSTVATEAPPGSSELTVMWVTFLYDF